MEFVKLVFTMFISFFVSLFYAFVASKLWVWFVVSTFHTAIINTYAMYGIIMLIEMFKFKPADIEQAKKVNIPELIATKVVYGLIVLGFGALAHHLM